MMKIHPLQSQCHPKGSLKKEQTMTVHATQIAQRCCAAYAGIACACCSQGSACILYRGAFVAYLQPSLCTTHDARASAALEATCCCRGHRDPGPEGPSPTRSPTCWSDQSRLRVLPNRCQATNSLTVGFVSMLAWYSNFAVICCAAWIAGIDAHLEAVLGLHNDICFGL
jgi:hypothetical protein